MKSARQEITIHYSRRAPARLTLMQHFAELRRRVLWTLLIFALAFGAGWFVAPAMQEFLTRPLAAALGGGTMLYTGLADGLLIQFDLATTAALLATIPVLLWHAWAFIAPGLRKNEKKFIAPILVCSPVLFALGAAFAFYIMFPLAFGFFVEMNQSAPVPTAFLPATKDYLSFAIGLLKVFGIAFQLPLVMVLLNRAGVLPRAAAAKSRRYAIVGIFIVAAILTPPDIVSQCLLAAPLLLLYEVGMAFMKREHR
jgi:sec-independent protein translocase protein TatC